MLRVKFLSLFFVLTKRSFACSCWLTTEHGFIWAFAGPVVCVLIVNTVMFVKALVIAHRSLARKQPEKNTGNTLTLLKGSSSYTTTQFDQRNYNLIESLSKICYLQYGLGALYCTPTMLVSMENL